MEACVHVMTEGGTEGVRSSSPSAFERYIASVTLTRIWQNLTENKTFGRIYSISTHYAVQVFQVLAMILTE